MNKKRIGSEPLGVAPWLFELTPQSVAWAIIIFLIPQIAQMKNGMEA